MKNRLFLFTLISLMASCSKDELEDAPKNELPDSEFTFEVDRHTEVVFSGSTVGDSYYWDFGDGMSSTKKNPRHVFPKTGEYEVVYSVTTAEGTLTSTQKVSVEIPIIHLISRKWVVDGGTKNEADYNSANGTQYRIWGDGQFMAGSLEFSWFFENDDHKTLVIDWGSKYPKTRWNIDNLTVYEMEVNTISNGDNYTYHFVSEQE